LPSWNEGKATAAIVALIPPAERIAVFDNDGTLPAEQPLDFQLLFAIDRMKALVLIGMIDMAW
jgi:hypothetical protein